MKKKIVKNILIITSLCFIGSLSCATWGTKEWGANIYEQYLNNGHVPSSGVLIVDQNGSAYDANGNEYLQDPNTFETYCIDPLTGTRYDPHKAGTFGTNIPNSNVSQLTPPAPKCSHEYTVKQTKAPNCTEEGENTYTCTKCGNTYTEPIPVNGAHNYSSEETTKPTCTESGEVTYTCIICGDTYTEPVEATGHDYSSEQTKAPTCTEQGEITYTCKNCGDTYTEPVEALGHTSSDWTVTKPSSLWVHGETIKTCTVCGEVLETKVIESTLPIWTLYAGIGAVVVLIVVIALLIKRYKRLHK